MKVLIISPTFPPTRSGGADFAFRQCELLAERGVDLHVITSQSDGVTRSERFPVSAVVRHWSWPDLRQILSIALRFRPDAVLIHFAGAIYRHHAMITFLPSMLKRWLGVSRIVLHVEYPHAINSRPETSLGRAADRVARFYRDRRKLDSGYGTLLRDSDVVFVLCEPHRALLEQHEESVSAKALTMGTPPSLVFFGGSKAEARAHGRAELGISENDLLFVYYGYLYPEKGLETLLDAFRSVVQMNPNARLLVLGAPNELILPGEKGREYVEQLKDRADGLGVSPHIIWSGYHPPESDRPSGLLFASDICVLPFDNGLLMHRSSFAVAAAHALPIVSTRGAELESIFIDRENVLLCEPREPAALAATLNSLIAEPEMQERLRCGAKKLANEHFSWERCIAQTVQALSGRAEQVSTK